MEIKNIDFKTIEDLMETMDVNLMIGNSDARRIEDKTGITLVRRGFPIHDRMGGQRLRMLGYEGSLTFLDDITNAILSKKETGFREELYKKYYLGNKLDNENDSTNSKEEIQKEAKQPMTMTIEEKTKTHPCYNCGAHEYARMHLPIAPACNIQCNYCLRKFDCPNESRPGVTTQVLTPEEAFAKFVEVKKRVPNLSVVGIAGPGDALANFENTKKTLELIKEYDPNITFCLSTNGLMLPMYANDLVELGVSHVTVTMNTIDPKIGAKIYKHINYMGNNFTGESGAAILLANQLTGIKMLTSKGIICKVNIVMLKGINDEHIPLVVEKVKELGGFITNIMQLIPVKGSAFEDMPLISMKEINETRNKCNTILKQMYHCKQCRADAIGTLENDVSIEFNGCGTEKRELPKKEIYTFAVASKSGMIVDQHFGMASEFYIYESQNGITSFKEKRNIEKYCTGSEECDDNEEKVTRIIKTISDCDGVIAMRIGTSPLEKLEKKGIKVYTTYDRMEDAVKVAVSKLKEERGN